MSHLIISDFGEIEAPEWFVTLWRSESHRLPHPWRGLPDRDTKDGLRVSAREAFLLLENAGTSAGTFRPDDDASS